jgi:hypothetical protein
MRLAIMQPYLFPYLGYHQLVAAVDRFVFLDDVNYIKGGRVNRNSILLDGRPIRFTLPLSKASPNKLISETTVVPDSGRKILKTIRQAYLRAPYYEDVLPLVERVFTSEESRLSRFAANSVREVANYLEIATQLMCSSEIPKEDGLKGLDRVLAICDALGADVYINSIGGTALYEKQAFLRRGVELKFLKMRDVRYRQFGDFVPNLSIIDVLMFNSKEAVRALLNEFDFI